MNKKYEPYLFGFFLSGMMSALVSAVAILRTAGMVDGFGGIWFTAWVSSWAVAFPAVLVVAPIARKMVRRLIKD